MKRFAELFRRLDETTKTNEKIAAMRDYFLEAPPEDAAWAIYFLSGRKIKRLISSPKLRAWTIEYTAMPEWLFEECYEAVGDLGEAIALLLPEQGEGSSESLRYWVEERLLPLRDADEGTQRREMIRAWEEMNGSQRFIWNKLITGSFRVGVSQRLVTRALAEVSAVDAAAVAHRLMGTWQPTPTFFAELLSSETGDVDVSRPYPFFLAYAVEGDPSALGPIEEWQVEWKWDGIRGQLIRRAGETFLWSRGEELVTDRYPEVIAAAERIPDGTVVDGELLPWMEGAVMPFAQLQRRIGRKTVGRKMLEEVPVIFLCYDLLEHEGEDIRTLPLSTRRSLLESIVISPNVSDTILLSPMVRADSWEHLATLRDESRDRNVEGFMLKRRESPYRVGRQRGDWWKWKIDPFTVDAVMIYAQRGHGRRASLYTDYTFGVWHEGELVPIAKAYSGLTDAEIRDVDSWVRRNTIERFGPVRQVTPEHVFELAFEGIQLSGRHKSGIAVRFPRILRWRHDKKIEEADTLENVKELIRNSEG